MDERPSGDGSETGSPTEVDPGDHGDDAIAPFDPSTIRDPLPQPLFSVRRLVILALLLVAAGCLVVAVRTGGGTNPGTAGPDDQPAIVAIVPTPGSRVIRQSTVGVTLAQGYDGRLTIDGTPIPEVDMEGAIVPGSDAYAALSDRERQQGPRPNNKEQVQFRPGPGKAVTELGTGEVQITVRFWPIDEGEGAARTYSYSIYTV